MNPEILFSFSKIHLFKAIFSSFINSFTYSETQIDNLFKIDTYCIFLFLIVCSNLSFSIQIIGASVDITISLCTISSGFIYKYGNVG
jgi:hypothetical protein